MVKNLLKENLLLTLFKTNIMKKTYKITVKEAEHIVMKEVLKIENPKKYGQYPLYIEYIE
jgi:hypothetical protein